MDGPKPRRHPFSARPCVVELSSPIGIGGCARRNHLRGASSSMSLDLERHVVETAYARWAPIYDAVCGPIMVKGRRAAAQAARKVGGAILEVGVGTGLSFDDY